MNPRGTTLRPLSVLTTLTSTLSLLAGCSAEDNPASSTTVPSDTSSGPSVTAPSSTMSPPATTSSPSPGPTMTQPPPVMSSSTPMMPSTAPMMSSAPSGEGGSSGSPSAAGGASGEGGAVNPEPSGSGGAVEGAGGAAPDGSGGAQAPDGAGGMEMSAGGSGEPGPSPLPPTEDYSDFGPFEPIDEAGTGPDGTYTIVRPDTLGEDGFLHAPIIYGPGIGMPVSRLMDILERVASHGFVIIGKQLDAGPNDPENLRRMTDGLDWLLEQNSTPGSVFEGKLDVDNAASMGYSVGGTGAVEVGAHEAIQTVVSIHGHGAEGDLHGTLLLMGGTEDVMNNGQSWSTATYEASQVPTFFSLVIGAPHQYIEGIYDEIPGGVETPAMIAWLRYWLYNDEAAGRYFLGDDCVMCSDPWTDAQRKGTWPE